MPWTVVLESKEYSLDGLAVSARLANGKRSYVIGRIIGPGTVSSPEEMVKLIDDWMNSEVEKMNKFESISETAIDILDARLDRSPR